MRKVFILLMVSLLFIAACSDEAKIEKLSKEVDELAARGKYLEAAEVQEEINALRRGEKYIKDENPEKTMEIEHKSNFEYLDLTDINVNWSSNSNTGDLTGKITNTGSVALDGYFHVYFFDDNDNIVDDYTIPVPDGGINPGESKYFSKPIHKIDYSYYEFQGDIITEK